MDIKLTLNISGAGSKALARCSKLSSLKIGICLKISDEGLTHIGRCCLNFHDIDLYRSLLGMCLVVFFVWFFVSKLTYIFCFRCGGISDDGIIQIAQGCPMQESINLSYCTEITDRSLISLSKCAKLNTLEIRGCPRVSSIGLSEIAMGCRLLSKLDTKNSLRSMMLECFTFPSSLIAYVRYYPFLLLL